jgi:hypothetical protein
VLLDKRSALDVLLDMIANIEVSIPESAWEDRDNDHHGHHHE